jgi:hypothetical protein
MLLGMREAGEGEGEQERAGAGAEVVSGDGAEDTRRASLELPLLVLVMVEHCAKAAGDAAIPQDGPITSSSGQSESSRPPRLC